MHTFLFLIPREVLLFHSRFDMKQAPSLIGFNDINKQASELKNTVSCKKNATSTRGQEISINYQLNKDMVQQPSLKLEAY